MYAISFMFWFVEVKEYIYIYIVSFCKWKFEKLEEKQRRKEGNRFIIRRLKFGCKLNKLSWFDKSLSLSILLSSGTVLIANKFESLLTSLFIYLFILILIKYNM